MPVELFHDLMLEILQWVPIESGNNSSIHNLALTNREWREIALPVLYRSVTFDITPYVGCTAMAKLIWASKRARALYYAPHLLKRIDEVILRGELVRREVGIPEFEVGDSRPMVAEIYNSVLRLISKMPGVRHLIVNDVYMTSRLHNCIFSLPRLDSLVLNVLSSKPKDIEFFLEKKPPVIRNLQYFICGSASVAQLDWYFPHFLQHCTASLRSFVIDACKLAAIVTWAAGRSLGLRSLEVSFIEPENAQTVSDLWALFQLCPQLRVLSIQMFFPALQVSLPPLAADVIPNLEAIYVPHAELAQVLIAGRPLEGIIIYRPDYSIPMAATKLTEHPMTHLRQLAISIFLDTYQKIFRFLQSLHGCYNLINLKIRHIHRNPMEDFDNSVTFEEIQESLGDSLRPLTSLHSCHILSCMGPNYRTGVGCPISPEYTPEYRGHSSLEEFRLECLSDDWWVWNTPQGWTRMPPSYQSPWSPLEDWYDLKV